MEGSVKRLERICKFRNMDGERIEVKKKKLRFYLTEKKRIIPVQERNETAQG